jgi:flagellar biogenesis protein FliO
VEELRTTVRVNVSMGLVFVSLLAELLFVLLVGYGLYRVVDVFR